MWALLQLARSTVPVLIVRAAGGCEEFLRPRPHGAAAHTHTNIAQGRRQPLMLLSSSRACSGGLVPQAQAQGRTRGPFHPCKRRASSSACWASTSGGSESGAVGAKSWGAVTSRLVGLSSIPFSVLVLPQVIQNFSNLSSGNAAALAVISWQVGGAQGRVHERREARTARTGPCACAARSMHMLAPRPRARTLSRAVRCCPCSPGLRRRADGQHAHVQSLCAPQRAQRGERAAHRHRQQHDGAAAGALALSPLHCGQCSTPAQPPTRPARSSGPSWAHCSGRARSPHGAVCMHTRSRALCCWHAHVALVGCVCAGHARWLHPHGAVCMRGRHRGRGGGREPGARHGPPPAAAQGGAGRVEVLAAAGGRGGPLHCATGARSHDVASGGTRL